MNTWEGRTTLKYWCLGEILELITPDQIENGDLLEGLMDIINGAHPLPILYMKYDKEGNYSLVGDQTRNIICSLIAYKMLASLNNVQRRINEYNLQVIVFEWTPYQDELIEQYKKVGFI